MHSKILILTNIITIIVAIYYAKRKPKAVAPGVFAHKLTTRKHKKEK